MAMKIEIVKYMLGEGVKNVNRNKLMSIASVSIVIATLIVFGIFYLSLVNISANMSFLREEPELYIECYPKADAITIENVEKYIISDSRIAGFEKISKADALAKMKEVLGSDSTLLDGLSEEFLPVSYRIKLKDPLESKLIAKDLEKISGIEFIEFSGDTIAFRVKVMSWIQIASAVMIIILMLNSLLIISNTIKLTVYARRKEIEIMKYIGATDWFIRWPFFVEGAMIGALGAVISFFLIVYIYSAVVERFNTDIKLISSQIFNFISLVNVNQIALKLLLAYVIIGITIGILGSYMSLRKHLVV